MSFDSSDLDHTPNPYASACEGFDGTVRPFVDAYLPPLVSVLTLTWDVEGSLSSSYLAQSLLVVSHQFGGPDAKTNMRALAWELADHVRVLNAISPMREPVIPEETERCDCGVDHRLEATATAAFMERAVAGDNAAAVRVLDAMWDDMGAHEGVAVLHVGSSLLGHVVGGMVFAHLHADCGHDHL